MANHPGIVAIILICMSLYSLWTGIKGFCRRLKRNRRLEQIRTVDLKEKEANDNLYFRDLCIIIIALIMMAVGVDMAVQTLRGRF